MSCEVGPERKLYQLQLKLASLTSVYFKLLDDYNSKDLDCPICPRGLQFGAEDITSHGEEKCGVRVHVDCMPQLEQRFPRPYTAVKCPVCRGNWEVTPKFELAFPDVEERSFDIYSEWLLFRRIETETQEEVGTLFEELIKAYAFGLRIIDVHFCNSILAVIIEQMQDSGAHINANHVTMAYGLTT